MLRRSLLRARQPCLPRAQPKDVAPEERKMVEFDELVALLSHLGIYLVRATPVRAVRASLCSRSLTATTTRNSASASGAASRMRTSA